MKFVKFLFAFVVCCILLGVFSVFGLYRYIEPQLPDVTTLKDIRLQTPMQIYSADGKLIAQYGEKRRIPLALDQIPTKLIQAFIATEDNRYYEHHGIDPIGMARAASVAFSSGQVTQGASTITQQLARNFYLNPERTLRRKLKEIFLAIRIEQTFNKDEILELYLNKIYLGQRAYGVAAAAHVYFGKTVNQLTLSEMAMIAGLPKAPSTFNPLYSHERAVARRNTVLLRIQQAGYISQQEYQIARDEPLVANYHVPKIDFSAPYLAEMVRLEMVKRYGENAYTDGYNVYTTITKPLQLAAEEAVHNNVINYDMRHGYRGPARVLWKIGQPTWNKQQIIDFLNNLSAYGPLQPAVVTQTDAQQGLAMLASGEVIQLTLAGVRWARPFRSDVSQGSSPKQVREIIQAGQQIWVRKSEQQWWLAQIPAVNSALVSISPEDGAVKALVGGFAFEQSKFNRVTQAVRQIGSNIKPFIYAAALDKGLTLATIMNDLPITRWDVAAGSHWRPKNSPPVYLGPIRIRQAIGQSKNVVMVRTMRAMGVNYAADYLARFGFPAANIVRTESLALGSASFTPMELVRAYAVFANGGFLVEPYFISHIESDAGINVMVAQPKKACNNCGLSVIYGETEKVLADISQINLDTPQEQPINNGLPLPSSGRLTTRVTPGSDHLAYAQGYAPHVISAPLAFLLRSALNSNIFGETNGGWMATGWRAVGELKRHDIGGKTGTTNNARDAWFSGYGPQTVTTVWIGFDDHRRTLGSTNLSGTIKDQISGAEGGAKSAQPAWNAFMKIALEGLPEQPDKPPSGIVSSPIDPDTGGLPREGGRKRSEYFLLGTEPTTQVNQSVGSTYRELGEEKELF